MASSKAKDTKEHILYVAFKLFLQKSYRDVTMNDMVRESGLSKGAFYHHFENKNELFIAVVNKYLFSAAEMQSAEVDATGTFREFYYRQLSRGEDTMGRLIEGSGGRAKAMNVYHFMFYAIEYYPGYVEKVGDLHRQEYRAWREAIVRAQEKGELKDSIDPEKMAQHISMLLDGVAMHGFMAGRPHGIPTRATKLFEQLYELIRA